ncbi:hypothetical protein Bbelb_166330 [Branchiostoma belcheri]|nr:hypothetical protein Bbelb_166330 [Branchiostoma belcheri]
MLETETAGVEGKSELVFFVNGRKLTSASDRSEAGLRGGRLWSLYCHGVQVQPSTGESAVSFTYYNITPPALPCSHLAVNACLAPICSLHGAAVTTVEGIGSTRTRLHPVQERLAKAHGSQCGFCNNSERLAKAHGSQCGFCTPGIVMSMYTLLRNHPCPDMDQLEAAFQGNLCRCTGYRPILEGYKTFTKEFQGCCGGMAGNGCCRNIQNGQAANGHAENGQAANGHAENGQAANGHAENGQAANGHAENGEAANGHVASGNAGNVSTELFRVSEFRPLDPTQEPIFPPELMKSEAGEQKTLKFVGERVTWIKPATFKEVLELKTKFPQAKLVVGNSEVGVEVKFKNCEYPLIIAPGHLPEINFHRYTEHGITFGAGCTLTYLNDTLTEAIADLPEHQTRLFAAIVEMLRWFAGHQIRNVGCIGGNIVTASPISDLNPIFLSAGCTVTVASHHGGSRVVRMDHDFFPGYRRTALAPQEVMVSLDVPFTKENEYFLAYKQARRRDDDIAIVNAAFRVQFEEGTNVIRDIALSFGGMAPTTVMARNTANRLTGLKWDNDLLPEACSSLEDDLPLTPSVPGGMAEFRRTLTTSFFFKFFLSVQQRLNIKDDIPSVFFKCVGKDTVYNRQASDATLTKHKIKAIHTGKVLSLVLNTIHTQRYTYLSLVLNTIHTQANMPVLGAEHHPHTGKVLSLLLNTIFASIPGPKDDDEQDVPPPYRSACSLYHRESPHGSQMYQEVPEGQAQEDAVGRPIMHLSALKHATGEAVYTDDMPPYRVSSMLDWCSAKSSIDPSAALQMPGVEMFVCAEDVPGSNITGVVMDEEVFASEKVTCVGQVVGAVLADTQAHAQRAAKAVVVQYEDLEPKIITIEDAILHQSFFHPINKIEKGNLQEAFEKADQIIEGKLRIGGQEHFYLETCAAIVVPHGEDGEMEIYFSTQNPDMHLTPTALDVPSSSGKKPPIQNPGYGHDRSVMTSGAHQKWREDGIFHHHGSERMLAAKALGIPANRVVCRVKRIGGGFGGKETRICVLSSVCAVAAHKAQRPVRIMLDRDEDMMIIGKRHPFLSRYKVGFMNDGRVVALDISLYSNAGNSQDVSIGVIRRALLHSDGGYTIPNVRAVGYVCKTNTVSNTSFRAFGGPQALFMVESWISDVAIKCGISQFKVREVNMNREGDLTHYNMKLERCQMERCWQECVKKSDFHTRRRQVNRFNGENRWKKRGLAAVPIKLVPWCTCDVSWCTCDVSWCTCDVPWCTCDVPWCTCDVPWCTCDVPWCRCDVPWCRCDVPWCMCDVPWCTCDVPWCTCDVPWCRCDVPWCRCDVPWCRCDVPWCMCDVPWCVCDVPRCVCDAGALVHVYTDGSVLLTHGGTEMGQGLHTKMVQVASRVLRIPTSKIHISEMSTNTVPNASATAASVSSDINGMAIKLACETILQRLEPYMGKGSWEDWVRAAYFDRVSLSATGFYRTPGLDYDMQKNEGRPFNYLCYGAAVSEVEIDCLTGDHTVLRTDIVMDVGDSLNPAIDIGQIEGAFVQGYGLFTMEEQVYSPDGVLFSRGPGMYKMPGFADIPVQLNVSLLRGAPNDKAIFSSKAVGEPPLLLASSVFFAIKDAVSSARADAGLKGTFRLDSPATAERIRMACQDQFTAQACQDQCTAQFPAAEPGSFTPWAIRL